MPPAVEPLEGRTTVDDRMFFEPERLSYRAAEAVAARIAGRVKAVVNERVVVLAPQSLLAEFANLRAAKLALEGLERDYQAIAGMGGPLLPQGERDDEVRRFMAPGLELAIGPVGSAIGGALGLLSFFREDVDFRGSKVAVDGLTFDLVLADQLRRQGAKRVFLPELFVLGEPSEGEGSLRARLRAVREAKMQAWAAAGPAIAELASADARLGDAARVGDQKQIETLSASVTELRRQLDPLSDALARADQHLSEFESWTSGRDDRTGLSSLAGLLRAEAIIDLEPVIVHAQVVASGGHHRISSSRLATLFSGDTVSASGGAIARWVVLGISGEVLLAGLEEETLNQTIGEDANGGL